MKTIQATAGEHIREAIERAYYMANKQGEPVTVIHNDTAITMSIAKAPQMITRTITYPAPYRGQMEVGQMYFIPEVTSDDFHTYIQWMNDGCDTMWQSNGLVHLTEEAAIAHAKALIGGEG